MSTYAAAAAAAAAATPSGAPIASIFRSKVDFMRSWKPQSPPSNRDRLELYSLHKQAVSGDAPSTMMPSSSSSSSSSATPTAAEVARYNGWRSKRGLSQQEAMRAYVEECNHQVRVYGTSPPETPQNTPAAATATIIGKNGDNNNNIGASGGSSPSGSIPRGLAAIPLLCAAAAETRVSYLHRMSTVQQQLQQQQTTTTTTTGGWWSRQEALCAQPGTWAAWPESILLYLATLGESISLYQTNNLYLARFFIPPRMIIPSRVFQSFLWPLHNVMLGIWMLYIFIATTVTSSLTLAQTLLLGAQRTQVTMMELWSLEITPCSQAAASLTTRSSSSLQQQEQHSLVVRLIGLLVLPLVYIKSFTNNFSVTAFPSTDSSSTTGYLLAASALHLICISTMWWYWLLVLPSCAMVLLWVAFWLGWCFALIEAAGLY